MGYLWNHESLKKLSSMFVSKVVGNMSEGAVVRFGTTGKKGIRPNYEIEYSDTSRRAFNGINHLEHSKLSMYKNKNLSTPFTFQTMNNLLKP